MKDRQCWTHHSVFPSICFPRSSWHIHHRNIHSPVSAWHSCPTLPPPALNVFTVFYTRNHVHSQQPVRHLVPREKYFGFKADELGLCRAIVCVTVCTQCSYCKLLPKTPGVCTNWQSALSLLFITTQNKSNWCLAPSFSPTFTVSHTRLYCPRLWCGAPGGDCQPDRVPVAHGQRERQADWETTGRGTREPRTRLGWQKGLCVIHTHSEI